MIVVLKEHFCVVVKQKGDKRFTNSNWGSAESQFLYAVKNSLIAQGFDLIKKRMWKDGHLVDDAQQYIRSRKQDKDHIGIYNNTYALCDAGEVFNQEGKFTLRVERLEVADKIGVLPKHVK